MCLCDQRENFALKVTTAKKLAINGSNCTSTKYSSEGIFKKILFRPLQKISWKKCLKATEKKFKYALGHIYVKEKEVEGKTRSDIEDVLSIISKIQKSLEDKISHTTWMDADTKRKASLKSKLIRSLGMMNSLERA